MMWVRKIPSGRTWSSTWLIARVLPGNCDPTRYPPFWSLRSRTCLTVTDSAGCESTASPELTTTDQNNADLHEKLHCNERLQWSFMVQKPRKQLKRMKWVVRFFRLLFINATTYKDLGGLEYLITLLLIWLLTAYSTSNPFISEYTCFDISFRRQVPAFYAAFYELCAESHKRMLEIGIFVLSRTTQNITLTGSCTSIFCRWLPQKRPVSLGKIFPNHARSHRIFGGNEEEDWANVWTFLQE